MGMVNEAWARLQGMARNRLVRKLSKVLGWAATLALFGILLLTSFLMVAPLFGLQTYTVLSGSMEPALKVGGITVCKMVPVREIEVGDIIAFNNLEGVKITHRVVSVAEENGTMMFRTKGDANEEEDPNEFSINGDRVHKVIFHIPYLGYFYGFIRDNFIYLAVTFLSVTVLLALFRREKGIALAASHGERKAVSTKVDLLDPDG